MIVQPDYFDHWKTRLLVAETGDEMAPYKLMRLWAYCQAKKTNEFDNLTPQRIKSICGFDGDPLEIYHILHKECAFIDEIERDGVPITKVHDWEEYNAQLIANWRRGRLGGRPPKPTVKPELSPSEPRVKNKQNGVNSGFRSPEPRGVSPETDKRREDKIREDKIRTESKEKEEEKERISPTTSFFERAFGKRNRKSQRVDENSDLMIRIGSWFGRGRDNLWQAEEAAAGLALLGEILEDEMKLLE